MWIGGFAVSVLANVADKSVISIAVMMMVIFFNETPPKDYTCIVAMIHMLGNSLLVKPSRIEMPRFIDFLRTIKKVFNNAYKYVTLRWSRFFTQWGYRKTK